MRRLRHTDQDLLLTQAFEHCGDQGRFAKPARRDDQHALPTVQVAYELFEFGSPVRKVLAGATSPKRNGLRVGSSGLRSSRMLRINRRVQPFLQPNPCKAWHSLAKRVQGRHGCETAQRYESNPDRCSDSLRTVFNTVARPGLNSWSRVGSTPMHLRHNLNSGSTTTAASQRPY